MGLVALVLALAGASLLLPPGKVLSAGLKQAAGALALLEQRSPGERTRGELVKVKHARVLSPEEVVERALGEQFPPERVLPATEEAFMSPAQLLDTVRAATPSEGSLGDFRPPASIGGGAGYFVPPTLGRGSGGFGDPGIVGDNPPPGDDDPPGGKVTPLETPPAVPEPGTWATMILGMGLCAFFMRRRRAPRREGHLCAAR